MVEYNLIRNGVLKSLTSPGTGNVSLTWVELDALTDNDLTSSGVTLTSSGVLYLEADLSQRIKVDGIRLYADDLTKSSNIKFYYKDEEGDSYAIMSTNVSSYYYPTLISPNAPRFVLATISGVNMDLYEYMLVNDDYIVAFGEDGTLTNKFLGDTPIGEESDPEAIAIYHNDANAVTGADAYTVVDYTGNDADQYISISATRAGTYYGVNDGVLIEDNDTNSELRWSMGEFNASKVSGDNVIISSGRLIRSPNGANFPRSAEHCWDYDSVNDKIYFVWSYGTIQLYELDYNASEWNYISELKPGAADHLYNVSIAYLAGKIYSLIDDSNSPAFGSHDLSGLVNNWTVLNPPSPLPAGTDDWRYNICSDYNRYIYTIRAIRGGSGNRYFARYDTVSGTWASLNSGYLYNDGDRGCNYHIWYDDTRNVIYAVTGMHGGSDTNSSRYVQRYRVADDAWDTSFFDVTSIIGSANRAEWAFAYVNSAIYMAFPYVSNTLYKYDLTTFSVSSISVEFTLYTIGYGVVPGAEYSINHMLGLNGSNTDGVLVANISGDRTYIHQYGITGGTYTTPIFELDNKYNSSYFITEGTAVSGTGSISYDPNVYNGSIRVKSSDTEPVVVNEAYAVNSISSLVYVTRWSMYPDTTTNIYVYNENPNFGMVVVNRRNGDYAISYATYSIGHIYAKIMLTNRNGSNRWWKNYNNPGGASNSRTDHIANIKMEFDYVNGFWMYGNYIQSDPTPSYKLQHFNFYGSRLAYIYTGLDFLYDFAVEWEGDGIWYTDKINNELINMNSTGSTVKTILLNEPRAVCSTTDNGCWVIDNTDLKAYRYTGAGILAQTVDVVGTTTRMVHDYTDGFWYASGNYVYHITSAGVNDITTLLPNVSRLHATIDGCVAYAASTSKFIDGTTGNITGSWADGTYYNGTFSMDTDAASEFSALDGFDLIPASYDPVWGTGGSLEWQEVRKDGYFLPKVKYHQTEITLRGDAVLEKIIMPPAIKVEDIQPDSYKNMYIKTDIPLSADIAEYQGNLRTWWGVVD